MMIRRCDRCGAEEDDNHTSATSVQCVFGQRGRLDDTHAAWTGDLCKTCFIVVCDFLKTTKPKGKP